MQNFNKGLIITSVDHSAAKSMLKRFFEEECSDKKIFNLYPRHKFGQLYLSGCPKDVEIITIDIPKTESLDLFYQLIGFQQLWINSKGLEPFSIQCSQFKFVATAEVSSLYSVTQSTARRFDFMSVSDCDYNSFSKILRPFIEQ